MKFVFKDCVSSIFTGIYVNITDEGHCYLGSAIGSSTFVSSFICKRISEWVTQIESLLSIVCSRPHAAAYSTFVHGVFKSGHTVLGLRPEFAESSLIIKKRRNVCSATMYETVCVTPKKRGPHTVQLND